MSITPSSEDPREPFQSEEFSEETTASNALKKRVYIGFAGCVAVGLAVAGLYIGGRLFARPRSHSNPVTTAAVAHPAGLPKPSPTEPSKRELAKTEVAKPEPPKSDREVQPEPTKPEAVPVSVPAAPQSTPAVAPQAGAWKLTTPKAGERYLQLAAMGPSYTDSYVTSLEGKGIHPLVAPGPSENIYRILVGPFSDQKALERQQDLLETSGIHPMPRVY